MADYPAATARGVLIRAYSVGPEGQVGRNEASRNSPSRSTGRPCNCTPTLTPQAHSLRARPFARICLHEPHPHPSVALLVLAPIGRGRRADHARRPQAHRRHRRHRRQRADVQGVGRRREIPRHHDSLGHDRPGAEGRSTAGKKHTTVELDRRLVIPLPARSSSRVRHVEMKLLGADRRGRSTVPMRPALFAVNREAGDLKLEQDFRDRAASRRRPVRHVGHASGKVKNDDGQGDRRARRHRRARSATATPRPGRSSSRSSGEKPKRRTRPADDPGGRDDLQPEARQAAAAGDLQGDRHRTATSTSPRPSTRTDEGLHGDDGDRGEGRSGRQAQVSKFDFAAGSDQVSVGPGAGRRSTSRGPIRSTYQQDKNLDKRPIQLVIDPAAGKTETFPKGLTLHAKTMITYELKGQYKSFRAMAGRRRRPGERGPEPGEDHDRRRHAGAVQGRRSRRATSRWT